MSKLIYCITMAGQLDLNAFDAEGLETVVHQDLAAIVQEHEGERVRPSRKNLLRYQRVLEQIMEQVPSLLPLRFGTVSDSADAVVADILQPEADALRQRLIQLENKREMSVTVSWDETQLFAQARQMVNVDPNAVGNDINAHIQVGQQVEAALNALHQETADRVYTMLAAHADEVRDAPARVETMSLNASFLVAVDELAQFEAAVEACDQAFNGELLFKLVGPMPPYSFVDLAIAVEEE